MRILVSVLHPMSYAYLLPYEMVLFLTILKTHLNTKVFLDILDFSYCLTHLLQWRFYSGNNYSVSSYIIFSCIVSKLLNRM